MPVQIRAFSVISREKMCAVKGGGGFQNIQAITSKKMMLLPAIGQEHT